MDDDGDGERVPPRLENPFGFTQDTASSSNSATGKEVDFKTKIGTAWSHNFLNQKPWHPLSYRNQRRKWIAEQTQAERLRRSDEVKREFAQEQEFMRQTALVSSKEKEKMEMMKAVSFMYVRPPGYNPESAKAAEIADEQSKNKLDQGPDANPSSSYAAPLSPKPDHNSGTGHKQTKDRPRDVFGRALPTEEEFQVLKNAPRLETGAPARIKPFAIEIRNVRCVRCGTYGHQSGDRECPMKDVIMPNDENRLKRDDPLTTINAQTGCGEPLKWVLKQIPGMSPPRGGFQPDDPNQQIVAEDIFDEYGGFLSGGDIPALLADFNKKPRKKHSSKHRHKERLPSGGSKTEPSSDESSSSDYDAEKNKKKSKYKHNYKYKQRKVETTESDSSDSYRKHREKRRSQKSLDSDGGDRKRKSKIKCKESRHASKTEYENTIRSKAKSKEKREHLSGSSSSDDYSSSRHHYRKKKHRNR